MTDRELMQQALDALEESVDTVRHEYETDWRHKMPTRKAQLEGMKAGLDAHDAAITALRERLAQPEQEPVACLSKTQAKAILGLALDLEKTGRMVVITQGQERTDFAARNRNIQCALEDALRNATPPPAAQRKPQYNKTEMNCFVQDLYDQKMREGKHGHYETMFHVVHRAIEAAHGIKEKNT
jgi:hypothetical protein